MQILLQLFKEHYCGSTQPLKCSKFKVYESNDSQNAIILVIFADVTLNIIMCYDSCPEVCGIFLKPYASYN